MLPSDVTFDDYLLALPMSKPFFTVGIYETEYIDSKLISRSHCHPLLDRERAIRRWDGELVLINYYYLMTYQPGSSCTSSSEARL